ncbi:MAG: ATP-binding cassette domain-containing protein [Spirochaetes bacterium]|nr:ATP-binding cassette domain-containing protein [Spirochaetota bacterium]
MIRVDGVSKSFGEVVAVDGISFIIRDGEITGLLGPNGAGKTTTLRMITCYLRPDRGSITVGDYRVDENPLEVRKTIGYLPELAPIYGDMLVFDYLMFTADIRGVQDDGRFREIAGLCGINDVMHKKIGELSKGYKQRVGLAYAMIHDPDILILDEPTSGLDPNQIIEIRNLIREIGRKKTVILSTHILSEVEATCDRVIIIHRGKIVADDRTENLKSSSAAERSLYVSVGGTDFSGLSGALGGIPGVVSVERIEGGDPIVSARIALTGAGDPRPEVFGTVARNGWVLYEMSQKTRSLESVFRELTVGGGDA